MFFMFLFANQFFNIYDIRLLITTRPPS